MSSKIIKLANKFNKLLKKADQRDPLVRSKSEGLAVEPELTEEINDLVNDNLSLVILMRRSFLEFQKHCFETNNSTGQKLADNALLELEDIEDAITNPEFLNFDIDTENSYIDVVDHNANMLKHVLDLTHSGHRVDPDFKELDQKVFKWVGDLIKNNDKIYDLAMNQSSYMRDNILVEPYKMLEQDKRDPDEINQDEIHVDHPLHDDYYDFDNNDEY